MKRNFLFWMMAALAAASLAFVGCQKPDEPEDNKGNTEKPEPGKPGPGEEPGEEAPVFPEAVTEALEAGGTYTLELQPNVDWRIELKYDSESTGWFWIKDGNSQVYSLRGKAGEKVAVTVCAGDQTDFDTVHSCTLEMTMGEETKTIATFTRGTVERTFTLAYCKVEDNGGDYIYNETEGSELQYEYNEALTGDSPIIPLEWILRSMDYRRSILISANFEWQLKSKPEWILDLKVTGGEAGKQVEFELEGDPTLYPLEDASAELVFCAKDNRDAAYTYTVQIPGCADMFSVSGFQKEMKANVAGEIFKENSMGDGSWVPAELGISGTVFGLEGSKAYTDADWVTLTLDSWMVEEGVVQSRNLNIRVTENTGDERQAHVVVLPAGMDPGSASSVFVDGGVADAYKDYAVTHITQAGVPPVTADLSIMPQDAAWMAEDGMATFEELDKQQYADLFTMTGAKVGYLLTYTSNFAVDAQSSNLVSSFEIADRKYYDVLGNEMSATSSWLGVFTFGKTGFRVEMYPEQDPNPDKAAAVWGLDVPHLGAIVLSDAEGNSVVVACAFNQKETGGEAGSDIAFSYPDMVSGATLEIVNGANLTAMNAKYAGYEVTFDEWLGMEIPVAVLTYTSAQPSMAMVKLPAVITNPVTQIMVNPYGYGSEWCTFEMMTESDISIYMTKPAADQSPYAILQVYQNWEPVCLIFCFPEF